MKIKTLLLFALMGSAASYADNPLVTSMYTADPTARVVGDKLFVFPSSDVPPVEGKGNNGFCMPYYHVFSSTNLLDWQDHGRQIDQNDVPWVEKDSYAMWAPDCIEKDGMFYYYFPAQPKGEQKRHYVGVAVAANAEGPYEIEPEPMAGVSGIDPNAFIDDDGTPYLYWGSGDNIMGCKLKPNMKELDGKPTRLQGLPERYKEATFMFKRDDLYYLTYSHLTPFGTCELSYSVGKSPLGEFEYKGAFMNRWFDCWTNHHSFVQYNGEWILFYHHSDISNKSRMRSICADYVSFDSYGNIEKVTPTMRGIGLCPANRQIDIDRYSEMSDKGAKITRIGSELPAKWQVAECSENGWVSYNRVDFGDTPYRSVKVRCSSASNEKMQLVIRNNGFLGDVIATIDIPNTGSCDTYKEVVAELTHLPSGVANLYCMFHSENGASFNIDWVEFLQ